MPSFALLAVNTTPESSSALPLRWLVVPAAIAALLLLVEATTDLDRAVSRLAFDAASGGFPLRGSFWLEVVMHQWTKSAVVTVAFVTLGALALSFVLPVLAVHRRTLLYLSLALALAPLSVVLAKSASSRHCPWDVDEFGGFAAYTRLLEPAPANVEPGHCFPAGHASTGFVLMAFYFAAYRRRMRGAARAFLALGIVSGVVLGAGRVLQGAHFASHVIASGLLCWAVMLALYLIILRDRPERPSLQSRTEQPPRASPHASANARS
jgi:membrane-associated PAP2 superfamily phosphatase